MVSLFFRQNGVNRRERQFPATSCSQQVWPSSIQIPFLHNREVWLGYLKKVLAAPDCQGWITVHWAWPPHCLLCQSPAWQRAGNANFVPSGDFLKTDFWLLQREQLSSHRVYTVQESLLVKIYYEHCRRKVHNKHNLSHSSQIHYWALTYEPTDLWTLGSMAKRCYVSANSYGCWKDALGLFSLATCIPVNA